MKSLIDEIKKILEGIDATEIESENGWWETSSDAYFGAEKLQQVIDAIESFKNNEG